MNTAQPIRKQQDLEAFMDYYKTVNQNPRNQLLISMGLNTALRISDLLSLQWENVYDEKKNRFLGHIELIEAKTGKLNCIYMNASIKQALLTYGSYVREHTGRKLRGSDFLFKGNKNTPISRVQAYRIIRKAADGCELSGVISPHSLRKTFGYHAWKQGTPPVLLMEIYHHSSFSITQRYLGIEQDDRDEVFKNICL